MPILGMPTFTSGILTTAQLNALTAAIEAKFAAQINAGDMSWPFPVGGNINMGKYSIVNLHKFWNAYNLADRSPVDSVQDVVDTLSGEGGGMIVVPGNTTITVEALGVTLADNIIFVGHGPSSVLAINDSASDDMFVAGAGITGAAFMDLTLRGNSAVNHSLVSGEGCSHLTLSFVDMDTHGTQPFVDLLTTPENILLDHCKFYGNGATQANTQVRVQSGKSVRIVDCEFIDYTDIAIGLTSEAAQTTNRIIINRNKLTRLSDDAAMTSAHAIKCDNSGAVANQGQLTITNNVWAGSGVGMGGLYIDDFDNMVINNNQIITSVTAPAVLMRNCTKFVLNNNTIDAAADGIIIGSSAGTEVAFGSRTQDACADYAVTGNTIDSENVALAVVMFTAATPMQCTVTGNRCATRQNSTNYAAFELWNCGADTSTKTFKIVVVGNFFIPLAGLTVKGATTYAGMGYGTTAGSRVGKSNDAWVVFCANHSPYTTIGDVANYDFHTAGNKTAIANNNT